MHDQSYASNEKTIGVRMPTADLKADLLFFDEIRIMGLSHIAEHEPAFFSDREWADLDYLQQQQAVGDAPLFRDDVRNEIHRRRDWDPRDYPRAFSVDGGISAAPRQSQADLLASTAYHPAGKLSVYEPLPFGSELVVAHTFKLLGENAVPVLSRPTPPAVSEDIRRTFLFESECAQRVSHVAEVVLNKIPTPGGDVPLEDVLSFVRDPSTRNRLESLRIWMRRTAVDVTATDLELELDSLLHDFTRHMEAADMRAESSSLRVAMAIPLGVVEELAHLRPKAAVDQLFALRDRKASLLESELSAPGNEVAYIRQVERVFGA